MKLAVLSDIHGNVPALESVLEDIRQWQPDKVVVNGDVVNRGPYSLKVLEMLQAFRDDIIYIKGNHEDFVLFAGENPLHKNEFDYHLRSFAQWTARQLGPSWLSEIASWKDSYDCFTEDPQKSIHITHGSRMGNRDGIHFKLTEDELEDKLVFQTDVFISSHTHLAMTRSFNHTMIMNTGSVGQPLDNDERAAYGRFYLHNGHAVCEIARVKYDKAQAELDFIESGFVEQGGPVCQLIFLEHKYNKRCVGPFMRCYLEAINSQSISVESAVQEYIIANQL